MDKRTVLRRFTMVGFVCFTILVVAVFVRQQHIANEARAQVEHTYKVREQIGRIYLKVKDLELGQRGFTLSGDSTFLGPYQRALYGQSGGAASANHGRESLTVWDEMQILRTLVTDNPRQLARAESLEVLVVRRVEYADSMIRKRRDEGLDAAVVMTQHGGGKRLMEETRALVTTLQNEEERLLVERLALEAGKQGTNSWILYGAVALFYAAWIFSLRLASRARARRWRAERNLREASARLDAVIHGIDYGVFVADADGILRIFSRGGERMLGYTAADYVGKPVVDVTEKIFLPEELGARAARIFKQYGRPPQGIEIFNLSLRDDGPFGQEWTNVRADGSRLTVAVSIWELRDEDGVSEGSVAMARDITALKANERMKNEFISTVSHELRTPLTSIRGALGLIAGGAAGPLPDSAREMVTIAYRNSERLVHIINDILDIDKIDSGKLTLYPAALDAHAFLKQALEANRPYGEKYGVPFVLGAVAEDLRVVADPDRLMQVMANLLSNAAKFSPAGAEVRVDAVQVETPYNGTMLRIAVRDQGQGIPEAFRSRVFDKFAQAEGTDTRRYEGTGLGLNITRKLVEAMGGAIGFDSEPGKGTTFHFDLPLASRVIPVEVERVYPPIEGRPRVLICEDDPDVGTLLRVLLERAGLAADVVPTLAETRARLETGAYAALTLDLMLPDGSGLTLLRALRREAATRELPVIVVSARAEEGRRELNGDAIGMIDWMTKPIDEERLAASMRRAIAGASGQGAAAAGRPRVLHVEDDVDFRRVLAKSLGDSAEWVGAGTLVEADALMRRERFDLVVLDIDLPDGSGLDLLERLKTHPGGPVPVLILSASETDNGVRHMVEAALVKSRLSEERIVETILAQIHKGSRPQEDSPT